MFRRSRFVLAFMLLAGCAEQPAGPDAILVNGEGVFGQGLRDPIVVMSRNLYLGADIDGLLDPTADPESVIAQAVDELVRTDFASRAVVLAREIQRAQPHAIGLQEATSYAIHLADGTEVPVPALNMPLDFLSVLQAELAALGESYEVAVELANLEVSLPIGELAPGVPLLIRYRDGEAILVRSDVQVMGAGGEHFETQRELNIAGQELENLRGWVWASIAVGGARYRVASTHLEIQEFRREQEEQARELVSALAGVETPLILMGDFNSAANHDAPADRRTDSYRILRRGGFADLWLRESHSVGGLTCCHASDLSNSTPELDQRIDMVFARRDQAGFGGRSSVEVIGDEEADRFTHPLLGYTLWPSDHAGLVATLSIAPGRLVP